MVGTVHFGEYHNNTISIYTESKFIAHFSAFINMYAICLSKPKTKIFHTNIFTHYLKYIVFFHTAPSPPEEGKPLPRPELATENAGSYNEGNHHEQFVRSAHLCHLCFCQILWNQVLSVGSFNNWICHCLHTVCPSPSLCTTLVHHPMPCVSPSSAKQTHLILVLSQTKQCKILISFSPLPFHSVSTPLHFHCRKFPFVPCWSCQDQLWTPIDLSNLSTPLGTGVLTSPKGVAPRSPVSSSAPPTQRKTPVSHPRVPQRPSRPFSTSKTVTKPRITTTTTGNTVSHFWFFLPSSYARFWIFFAAIATPNTVWWFMLITESRSIRSFQVFDHFSSYLVITNPPPSPPATGMRHRGNDLSNPVRSDKTPSKDKQGNCFSGL